MPSIFILVGITLGSIPALVAKYKAEKYNYPFNVKLAYLYAQAGLTLVYFKAQNSPDAIRACRQWMKLDPKLRPLRRLSRCPETHAGAIPQRHRHSRLK